MSPHFYNISIIAISSLLLCVATVITTITWSSRNIDTSNNNLIVPDIQLEIQAVRELHGHLDDDKNGQVDSEESEEFAREELSSSQYFERSKKFHSDETLVHVSSDELWNKWITSKTHNWTCDQVIEWLKYIVQLPDLIPVFRDHHITGRFLPLIATNSGQFLNLLNISKHEKTKLQIKAMDVVLFGPPQSFDSYWKDTVMVISVVICVAGLTYAWRKQSLARIKIDKFLEEIRDYESELQTLRNSNIRRESTDSNSSSLKEDESPQSLTSPSLTSPALTSPPSPPSPTTSLTTNSTQDTSSIGPERSQSVPNGRNWARSHSLNDAHENELMRMRISELESMIESMMNDRKILKTLLQNSCHSEWTHLEIMRKKAEEEIIKAQKVCDKIKHKRSSVIGAFRLANSSTLEDAGLQITRAVNKMHKIAENFHEFNSRWKKIEAISHLSINITRTQSSSDMGVLKQNMSQNSLEIGSVIITTQDPLANITTQDPLADYDDIDYTKSQVGVVPAVSMETKRWHIGSSNEILDVIEENLEQRSETYTTGSEAYTTGHKKPLRLNSFKKSFKQKPS